MDYFNSIIANYIDTLAVVRSSTPSLAGRYLKTAENWSAEAENRLILCLVQTQNPASLCRSHAPSILLCLCVESEHQML